MLFNVEGEVGVAPIDRVEVNAWMGLQATGFEVRAQPLSERSGAPLSTSLSIGVLTPSLVGFRDVGLRFGADMSRHLGSRVELLLGGYGSWEPRQRNMKSDDFPDDGDGHIYPGEVFGVTVVRDEWKLSVPVGLQIDVAHKLATVVGIVPEFTLASKLVESECVKVCAPGMLSRFDQSFALYLTVGFEIDVYRGER